MEGRPLRGRRMVGASAILAGLCQVAWFVINGLTGGGLDSGQVLASTGLSLIVAWNLLLVSVALHLARWLGPVRPALVSPATACGIAGALLWGVGLPLGYGRLEVAWIALSAAWWLGVGPVLCGKRKGLGTFTIIVGIAAALDALATALVPRIGVLAFALLGGWKLPLALAWDFWAGISLLLVGQRTVTNRPSPTTTRPAGPTAPA